MCHPHTIHVVLFILGPLYVIVEYCEDGSLLGFLRNSRLQEAGFENHRFRHRHHAGARLLDSNSKVPILTIPDLLAFAWQIARGMHYLSDMKVGITNY